MNKEQQIRELINNLAMLHYCEYMDWDYTKVKERERFFDSSEDMKREMYGRAERTLKLIKAACYLKADGELPEIPQYDSSGVWTWSSKQCKEAQQDMLTPDSEGRVWASVYREW